MEYRCTLRRADAAGSTWHGHITLADSHHDRSVVSCGVDVVDADRLAKAVNRTGPALLRRVLTAEERALPATNTPSELCSLFGVKESVVKTVGGLARGASFHDIQVGEDTGDGHAREVMLRGRLHGWPHPDTPAEIVGSRVDIAGLPPVCWTIALGSRGRR